MSDSGVQVNNESLPKPTEQKKFVFELAVGDILSRPVYAKDGTVLIDEVTILSPELLNQLYNWKIETVSIQIPEEKESDVQLSIEAPLNENANHDSEIVFNIGSLESEEPIQWDEIEKAPPPPERPIEKIEEKMEEWVRMRPQVKRKPITPPSFQYDFKNIVEAKKEVVEVHRKAIQETNRTISSLMRRDSSNVSALRKMIESLVNTGLSNNQVLSALTSLSHYDDFLLAHAVSTTVYSILTGYMMGLSQPELYELAEATLLHDIGMCRIPRKVWMKPRRLTIDEQITIQKHTLLGADCLHDIRGISFMSEMAAYQHHERYDGSGYPKGRKNLAITEYARIIALVDVYAAMTSPRPYRARILGYNAMKYIITSSSSLFDPYVVKAFLRCMALYPIGSMVELSDGSTGIVVASNPLFPYRPHVKIMRDATGADAGSNGEVIDLLKERNIGIIKQIAQNQSDRNSVWNAF